MAAREYISTALLLGALQKKPEFPGKSSVGRNWVPWVIFTPPSMPYGQALRREFFDYLAAEKVMAKFIIFFWPVVRWVNSMVMLKSEERFAVVYYSERVISKLLGRKFRFKLLWTKLDGALYCFCVNRTVENTRAALEGSKVLREPGDLSAEIAATCVTR